MDTRSVRQRVKMDTVRAAMNKLVEEVSDIFRNTDRIL